MLLKAGCFRQHHVMLYGITRKDSRSLRKAVINSVPVSAAPAVDIGSTPSPADGDAPTLLRLHERCIKSNQPFSWPSAPAGVEASELLRHDGAAQDHASPSAVSENGGSTANSMLSRPSNGSTSPAVVPSASTPSPSTTSSVNGSSAAAPASSPPRGDLTATLRQQPAGDDPPSTTAGNDANPRVETDEYCAETHPGSLCCTSTAVEKDATSSAFTVTLRTTVKLTDSRLHVAPAELEELAWLAARDAASAAVSALNRQCTALLAGREDRHSFVSHMLRHGTIRDAKRMENGFGHVSYLVTLEDKATGMKMRAAFKPRVEGDCEGWHRVPVEVAAYQLNLLLGMDVVPPAVMRGDCDVDWTHYPAGGAFIYWCSNARQLNSVSMSDWSTPSEVLLSDTRILDVLIQNSDRHAGHFLYAEHWADGDYAPLPAPQRHGGSQHHSNHPGHSNPDQSPAASSQQQPSASVRAATPGAATGPSGSSQSQPLAPSWWAQFLARSAFSAPAWASPASGSGSASGFGFGSGSGQHAAAALPPAPPAPPPPAPPPPSSVWRGRMRPVLIDHAAGFRQDAFVCLDHENAFLTGPTRRISARTYLRLRFLDAASLRSAMAGAGAGTGAILSDDEIAALLSRRDSVLAFFDQLVAEQGYDNVVLEV